MLLSLVLSSCPDKAKFNVASSRIKGKLNGNLASGVKCLGAGATIVYKIAFPTISLLSTLSF